MSIKSLLFIAILFAWSIVVVQIAKAAPYTSPPQSLDTTFFGFEGTNSCLLWQQADGSWYHYGGQWMNAVSFFNSLPKEQVNESTSDYLMRARPQIAARETSTEEEALCQSLRAANVVQEVWLSRQNFRCGSARDELCETNLVYRIVDVEGVQTVDRSDKIGRIPHSTVCGDEIFSGTRSVYREVPVQYQNAPVIGGTICRKQ